MSRVLDFLCIGATKAGTTSFFHYIKEHPQIFVPSRKEALYFDDESQLNRGWDTFYDEHFHHATDSQRTGKMAPRYLRDPAVAHRIFEFNPDIRLLIILRNPIERAFSHYRMLNRLERESRSFSELVNDQMVPSNLEKCRTSAQSGEFSLLTQGEYGRILEGYLNYFGKDQILILFSENLDKNPALCLSAFYDFIEVRKILPDNLERKYHVGGDKARFLWLYPFLKRLYFPTLLWNSFSNERKKQLILWYNTKLKVSSDKKMHLNHIDRQKLTDFYSPDVRLLEKLFGIVTPWSDFN